MTTRTGALPFAEGAQSFASPGVQDSWGPTLCPTQAWFGAGQCLPPAARLRQCRGPGHPSPAGTAPGSSLPTNLHWSEWDRIPLPMPMRPRPRHGHPLHPLQTREAPWGEQTSHCPASKPRAITQAMHTPRDTLSQECMNLTPRIGWDLGGGRHSGPQSISHLRNAKGQIQDTSYSHSRGTWANTRMGLPGALPCPHIPSTPSTQARSKAALGSPDPRDSQDPGSQGPQTPPLPCGPFLSHPSSNLSVAHTWTTQLGQRKPGAGHSTVRSWTRSPGPPVCPQAVPKF